VNQGTYTYDAFERLRVHSRILPMNFNDLGSRIITHGPCHNA
jgi:hypothetical protein